MTLLLAILVNVFGLVVFSFTITNLLLIIFVAAPTTKKLFKNGHLLLDIKKIHFLSALIQAIIFLSITFFFYYFFTYTFFISLLIGYFFGFISLCFSFKKINLNIDNLSDYFLTNRKYIYTDLRERYESNPQQTLLDIKNMQ
jgi:hypothetical protein